MENPRIDLEFPGDGTVTLDEYARERICDHYDEDHASAIEEFLNQHGCPDWGEIQGYWSRAKHRRCEPGKWPEI